MGLPERWKVARDIRFGVVSESVMDGPAWAEYARRVEAAGVGSLLIRDHFSAGAFGQQLAPFSALAAAAAVTTGLRVGTMVLSNDFRHPAIVAHEAASLHHLSGGRFELGLGAGWYEPEYRAAGLRFDRLSDSLSSQEVRRLYRAMREVVQDAIRFRGTTLGDDAYVDLNGKPGSFRPS